ncbi:sialate O-acetylesterase [Aminobacter sp. NyZ550]|uniref:sialate O-acetylesterase n=1 Tax=Aminobacter sp. NyZ550 TaxID=2979870 RepID=UPI0021D610E7|nr:sialate O-acetylesterase [Aminobacter sp. NyZ550]WAX93205.1 sialate O-acetylesterase [Aminobacter sp. NyZ550]
MTSLVYSTGTVAVSNASAVVTGTSTAWALALVTGGMFSFAGMSVPILSVESDTSLTLAYPWPGATASGAYAIARETSEAVRAAWINDRLAQILTKLALVGIHPDGAGTLAERNALSPVPAAGYLWLRVEVGFDLAFYKKTASGWDGPFAVRGDVGGQGPAGPQGLPGADGDVTWDGPWVTATAYTANQAVSRNGASYVCTANHAAGAANEPGVGASWATVWDLMAAKGDAGSSIVGTPIVILVSGQSNPALEVAHSWTVPSNLKIWDWSGLAGDTEANVGTEFLTPTGSVISVGLSIGAHEAWANPDRDVYLINMAYGGQPISKWLVGATTPKMFDAIQANVSAALTLLGLAEIDALFWWQGEADALGGSATYVTDFATLMARFRSESWYPDETPVTIFGMSSLAGATYGDFNRYHVASVAAAPDFLRYVHTPVLPSGYWDPTGPIPNIHANASGLFAAGSMGWEAWRGGRGRASVPGMMVDPATGNIMFGLGVPDSADKRVTVRKDQNSPTELAVENLDTGTSARALVSLKTTAGLFQIYGFPTSLYPAYQMICGASGGFQMFASHATGWLGFSTGGRAVYDLTIDAAGNLNVNWGGQLLARQGSYLTADRTGTDGSTAQAVFGSGQDELSVLAATSYRFRASITIARTAGTTSHTTGFLLGGTATFNSVEGIARCSNPTGNVLGAASEIEITSAAETVLTAANTAATERVRISLEGIIRVNAAGTVIPQFKFSAAPGGAPTIKRNSFFEVERIGVSSVASIGAWS